MMMTMYQHRIQFLSTPSARRATVIRIIAAWSMLFLSTPSARRATRRTTHEHRQAVYFYPRPPRGGRPASGQIIQIFFLFLSTPSARRATAHSLRCRKDSEDFYPRPPRGGRPALTKNFTRDEFISIHALREEGDEPFGSCPAKAGLISIHALREEGDQGAGGTRQADVYFYPRPPRGGRQQKQRQNLYFQTNYTTFCTNLEEP